MALGIHEIARILKDLDTVKKTHIKIELLDSVLRYITCSCRKPCKEDCQLCLTVFEAVGMGYTAAFLSLFNEGTSLREYAAVVSRFNERLDVVIERGYANAFKVAVKVSNHHLNILSTDSMEPSQEA